MSEYYLGLISGTSMDAADAVLLEAPREGSPRILASHAEPVPPELRARLSATMRSDADLSLQTIGELHQQTGEWFARAANDLIRASGVEASAIRAIGSHGQTILHAPDGDHSFSWQLGDPNLIARRTGLPTVADFRQADIAAGGQGAPLVPAFHHAVFSSAAEGRCIVNIGGIANLTVLPQGGLAEGVTGFDTGPGNTLLDAWIARHCQRHQDTDAAWAGQGRIDPDLLERLRADAYFKRTAPKSTGPERFNPAWLDQRLAGLAHAPQPVDVQRTLVELTAATIADAIVADAGDARTVMLCGGGAHNPLLRSSLAQRLGDDRRICTTGDYGIDGDWVEAAAFAWLAMQTLNGRPGNLPSVTGAQEAVVLGGVYDSRVKS